MHNHITQTKETKNKHTWENSNHNNDKINTNANTVVINPFSHNNINSDTQTPSNSNMNANNNQQHHNHKQRINFIINNKYLIHPDIDIDRMDTNHLILFDKYESLLQLNKNNENNNIFYSIRSDLYFNDPNPIVSPVIDKGKIKHYKLTFQSIDIAKHFIAWFFHLKTIQANSKVHSLNHGTK